MTEKLKWQYRDRPQFSGHSPEWEDCYVERGETKPTFWLQCEYRQVPISTKSPTWD